LKLFVPISIAILFLFLVAISPPIQAEETSPSAGKLGVFQNVQGGEYELPKSEVVATVLIFFGHDCPMSNGYVPEINRLYKEFESKNIAFCIVYADADLSAKDAAKHAKEYGFACPAILDADLKLASTFGATVLSADHALLYRGRIDDRYIDFGKLRSEPTVRELHAALSAVLAGKPIAVARAKAIGCDIDFPKQAKP
jgi:AhpC/TSA family